MIFPTFRQVTAHRDAPEFAFRRVTFRVLLDKRMPLGFELLAAWNGFTVVRECFVRNVKLLVFGPAEVFLRFAHSLFTRRVAVSFACALRRHAEPDHGLD